MVVITYGSADFMARHTTNHSFVEMKLEGNTDKIRWHA